ncbi:heterokaryon incompatibility protein-domain-containing protein [Tricladium varicosporioides]|nr:heterokaryon incompatibility protein-domain-containing protein [Hymenoscyphus varicosporioides]
MRRDTLEPLGKNHRSAIDCHAQIVKVAAYTLRREDTQKWAQNLRFLTYDGGGSDDEQGENVNDEGKDDDDEDNENEEDEDEDNEDEDSEDEADEGGELGGDEDDGSDGSDGAPFPECVKCRGLPYFPHSSPVKALRLTGDLELGDCSDYLAVSYCWSQTKSTSPSSSGTELDYVIRKPDGTKRSNIAPKEILDRSIYIAANYGFRLIWIDQECIDQNDRMDKEFGIQSMDVVFERSSMVIGPLSLTIESDIKWNALKLLKIDENLPDSDGHQTASANLAEHGLEVFQILESLISDRWFTRAWILQEMVCASSRLILLLKSSPDVVLDEYESKEFNLVYSDFRGIISRLTWDIYYNQVMWKFPLADYPAMRERLMNILHQFQYSSPLPDFRLGSVSFDHRTTCNAIEAIQYLTVRNNSRTPDQLAILANLCHYPIRLNTTVLESDVFSLSTCILTLAILNGDLSLLVGVSPEEWDQAHAIQPRRTKRRKTQNWNTPKLFSWLPPQSIVLKELNWSFENSCTCRVVDPKITCDGLSLQGYLWQIDRQVFFEEIQKEYGPAYMEIQNDEAKLQYHPKFARIYWEVLKELHRQNLLELANAIWHFVRAENDTKEILGKDANQLDAADSFHLIETEEYRDSYYQRNDDEELFMRYIDATEIVIWNLEKEARERLGEVTPRLKWLMRREWLIDKVLRNGFLWVGGLASSDGGSTPRAIFDIDKPVQILTPHCTGIFGPSRDKIRLERMSWCVEPYTNGQNSFITSGMVRGMWNIEDLAPKPFTLL